MAYDNNRIKHIVEYFSCYYANLNSESMAIKSLKKLIQCYSSLWTKRVSKPKLLHIIV